MESIISNKKECYVCGYQGYVESHHIMFGQNRKKADEDGLTCYLCVEHHRGTNGVHGRKGHELDLKLKKKAEEVWIEYYSKDKEEFIKRYHKNYL